MFELLSERVDEVGGGGGGGDSVALVMWGVPKESFYTQHAKLPQQPSSRVKKIFLKCWETVRHHGSLDSEG